MKITNFKGMLIEIEKDRGIKEEDLLAAIKDSLVSAYKKRLPEAEGITAEISDEGEAKVFLDGKDVTPKDFGRLAAQTAKQVIIQRLREAEKEGAYEEYHKKIGILVVGTIQNKEYNGYLVNLGKIETFLPFSESVPTEDLQPKDKVRLLILDVQKTPKGPLVVISRSHPDLVKRLFEAEISEISQGILEIKSVAREAGRRTKVAVLSNDKDVGAVGTCVGPMGSRIQNITRELGTERIDIIEWSKDDAKFIANSLSPAKVLKVEVNKEERSAKVYLSEKEFSLAIGKEGQNVRLSAKLTGYKIDIVSEDKIKKPEEAASS